MPKYWRISDRAIIRGQPSSIQRGPLTFWIADKLATDGTIDWDQISQERFRKHLIAASDAFPVVEQFKDQPHVTLMRQVLRGLDRDVLVDRKIAPPPKL